MICAACGLIQGPTVELPSIVLFSCSRPVFCSRPTWLRSLPGLKSLRQLPSLGQKRDVREDFYLKVVWFWFYQRDPAVLCRSVVPSSECGLCCEYLAEKCFGRVAAHVSVRGLWWVSLLRQKVNRIPAFYLIYFVLVFLAFNLVLWKHLQSWWEDNILKPTQLQLS